MQLLTKKYLIVLFNKWGYWEKYKTEYFELFSELITDPKKAEPYERELITKILKLSSKRELLSLSNKEIEDIYYSKYSLDDIKNELKIIDNHTNITELKELSANEKIENEKKYLLEKEEEQKLLEKNMAERKCRLEEINKHKIEVENFYNLIQNAAKDEFNINISPNIPTPEDMELIQLWKENKNVKNETEEERLLSARLAEKAVASFFRSQGKRVEDISITQIDNSNNGDWEYYDLNICNKPVDVKNARRCEKQYQRYVNFCIPSFKRRRKSDVQIAGVLSCYDPICDLQNGNGSPVLFLGTTSKKKHDNLQKEFSESNLLKIDFQTGFDNYKKFLPFWIFDYPDYMYKLRKESLNILKTIPIPNLSLYNEKNINPIPAFIAAGLKHNYDLSSTLLEFEKILRQNISKNGFSLPIIFLSVLHHFLYVLASDYTDNYDPYQYNKLIFSTNDKTRPLFIYDPLETINELIQCLSILWEERTDGLKNYKYFKLQGFHILLGSTDNKTWVTLLAYCGECGKSPLIFGRHENCPSCYNHKLICPKCDFCSINCSRHTDQSHATIPQ